ncbi:MAG: hypothetical protein GX087_05015 [Desulfobulbaceae bacterium]|nr:hypothetical protein [Desulfobulbaceae bacterium]
MTTVYKTLGLAAVLGLGLVLANPAAPVQAGERIIFGSPFFTPGMVYQVDRQHPRYRYVTPGRSFYYGPSYYYGNYRDDRSRYYRDRYFDGPRYYRDRDRFYDGPRYYRDRDRDRYYDRGDYRRYREERMRRDTYREQRIPKNAPQTMQERRWSR